MRSDGYVLLPEILTCSALSRLTESLAPGSAEALAAYEMPEELMDTIRLLVSTSVVGGRPRFELYEYSPTELWIRATSKVTIPTVNVEGEGDVPLAADTGNDGDVAMKAELSPHRDWGNWQDQANWQEEEKQTGSPERAEVLSPKKPSRATQSGKWELLLGDDRTWGNLPSAAPNEESSDTPMKASGTRAPARDEAERLGVAHAKPAGSQQKPHDMTPDERRLRGTLPAAIIARLETSCTRAEQETVAVEYSAAPVVGQRQRGTVKTFNPDKGYGFVRVHGASSDIFLSANRILGPQPGVVFAGQAAGPEMEFDIEERNGRHRAVNASIVVAVGATERAERSSIASTPSVASCSSESGIPKADRPTLLDPTMLLKMLPSDAPLEVREYLSNLVVSPSSWI
jgi:cold shock CspA family protein